MDTCGVRAIHPPPERGGFPRIPLKKLALDLANRLSMEADKDFLSKYFTFQSYIQDGEQMQFSDNTGIYRLV